MEHPLSIYNTLTEKGQFIPLHEPHVGMYVCGPTVYGDAHLGHARPAITFDLLFRYLTHIGYKVRYVRNITDVGHLEHDADDGEDKNRQESPSRTTRTDGGRAILPEPLPPCNGSAQRIASQHRTACVRPHHRTDRTGQEDTG